MNLQILRHFLLFVCVFPDLDLKLVSYAWILRGKRKQSMTLAKGKTLLHFKSLHLFFLLGICIYMCVNIFSSSSSSSSSSGLGRLLHVTYGFGGVGLINKSNFWSKLRVRDINNTSPFMWLNKTINVPYVFSTLKSVRNTHWQMCTTENFAGFFFFFFAFQRFWTWFNQEYKFISLPANQLFIQLVETPHFIRCLIQIHIHIRIHIYISTHIHPHIYSLATFFLQFAFFSNVKKVFGISFNWIIYRWL